MDAKVVMEQHHKDIQTRYGKISVYAIWSGGSDESEIVFYDIYDQLGVCLNEGEAFHSEPTKASIEKFLRENPNL